MSVSYGGDKITFDDGTSIASGLSHFRNRIINGDMRIDQRNAGASVSIASGGNPYTLDRFRSDNSTDGAITVQRVTDAPTGFVNSMKYTVTTADASLASNQYLGLNHFTEGFNTADLMWGTANAKTITISFWVKSSITGNYPVSFDNNAGNRFYIGQYSISSANTWEYKTVTIAGDTSGTWNTDNERGISVRWLLGSGTGFEASANSWQTGAKYTFSGAASVIGTLNATWQITGVQLEQGSSATTFERRPYGTELVLCQRYYERFTGGSNITYKTGYSYNTFLYLHQEFKVAKRTISGTNSSSASGTTLLSAYGTGNAEAFLGGLMTGSVVFSAVDLNGMTFYQGLSANTYSPYGTAILWGLKNAQWIEYSAEL